MTLGKNLNLRQAQEIRC